MVVCPILVYLKNTTKWLVAANNNRADKNENRGERAGKQQAFLGRIAESKQTNKLITATNSPGSYRWRLLDLGLAIAER